MLNQKFSCKKELEVNKVGVTYAIIKQSIDYATQNDYCCVCIPPSFVSWARKYALKNLKLATTISMPNGYCTTIAKVLATKLAIKSGVDEIEVCINYGELKSGNVGFVLDELRQLKRASRGQFFKVYANLNLLEKAEREQLYNIIYAVKADCFCFFPLNEYSTFNEEFNKIKEILGKKIKYKIPFKSVENNHDFLKNEGELLRLSYDFEKYNNL